MREKKYWILAGVILLAIFAVLRREHRPGRSAAEKNEQLAATPEALAPVVSPPPPQAAEVRSAQTTVTAAGSVPSGGDLFRYIARPARATEWETHLSTPSDDVHYVQINREAATGKASPFWKMGNGGRLDLALPDGRTIPVVLDSTQQSGADGFQSVGHIEGQGYGRALFAYQGGEMSALVEDLEHGSWQLRAMADGVAQWYKIDGTKIGPCGITPSTRDPQKLNLLARRAEAAARTSGDETERIEPPVMAADAGYRAEIRILMVYTNAVAALTSVNAIASQMNLAISTLNDDWARSQIGATATLAGTLQVPYADDDVTTAGDGSQGEALDRLADPLDGFMDTVHASRDATSADLVCLSLRRRDNKSAGIAFLIDTPGNVHNATQAFSVVDFGLMTAQSVFSHEIGHNLGCAHDRENSKDNAGNPTQGAYPYSYGYRFNGANGVQYRTIMSYAPGQRLAYFSNPDITAPAPISRPVGIAAGQPGEADNARTIRQDAFEVASYRLSTQAPANVGRLINVSTRAYVGTGAQQLIGGFIISGSQSKRMLIRAIGPTLSQFNVTDSLANPTMRLVRLSDGAQVDQNDDWGSGPNAAAVAAAIAEARAFVLPAGSRDSAITATLSPGNYTANIEGVGGTTGTALIEAYELTTGSSRVSNLSTRGYADVSRPLIGGFIVQADPANPGKTKRIVVRVLGPSLANFGVTGAMNDPMFELHDGSQALILTNDDWSSGNIGGDDARPLVKIYSEQQIAAANLAPGNRRDCAVMVDLLPGAYTAIVKPFELLPNQVQSPGVAIVEVFEITP